MRRNKLGLSAKYALVFIIPIMSLLFVGAFVPQSFKSQSYIDLIINNMVYIAIAYAVSVRSVQGYESRHQNMVFINDLLRKLDSICDSIKNLILEINTIHDNERIEIDIRLYQTNVKSIVEYIKVIAGLIDKNNVECDISEIVYGMIKPAKCYLEYIENSIDRDGEGIADRIKTCNESYIRIIEVQTYIPKLMLSIQGINEEDVLDITMIDCNDVEEENEKENREPPT